MKRAKRFSSAGYVTSEDSNSGMKEAYDDRIAAEEVKRKADVENEGSKVSEGERVSMTPPSKPTSPAAPTAPAKPRVVSKAELEKSGMSLRDFLNKERGLTRRKDSSAPAKAEPKTESKAASRDDGAYRGMRSETKPEGAYRGDRSDTKAAKDAEQAKLMGSYKPRRPDVKLRDADYQYPATGKSGAFTNKQLKRFGAEERSESEEKEMFGKKRGGMVKKKPVAKYASGGSVSSASRRADGIATKGKTRGKMC